MDIFQQIMNGTLLLVICNGIHVTILAGFAPYLERIGRRIMWMAPGLVFGIILSVSLVTIVVSHTIQVWLWAVCLIRAGAFLDLPIALYFSMVTYTTLGYGDVTLGPDTSLFASFAAVSGLIAFGMSTAFTVAIFSRFFPREPEIDE